MVIVIFSNSSFWNLFQKKHHLFGIWGTSRFYRTWILYNYGFFFFKKLKITKNKIRCRALEEAMLTEEAWSLSFINFTVNKTLRKADEGLQSGKSVP